MNGQKVSIYLQQLIQHLSVATSTKTDGARKESFANEGCSYPPVPVDHKLLQCSGAKSKLADAIWRQVDSEHKDKPAVTDAISTDEARVKTMQIIERGLLDKIR